MRTRETEAETDDLYKLICNLSIPSRRSGWFLEMAEGNRRRGGLQGRGGGGELRQGTWYLGVVCCANA